tara:strand:- start:1612 stop:2724 length:1113 start_codon:yes stop_codon:yes gene_type:complete
MIDINNFIKHLKKNDLDFCCGVPDSLLKDLCFAFENKYKKNHLVAANEGSAVGLGIGYHLSTKKIPLIYLQNSGLGNAINPLISLSGSNVYKIPLFLIIGWRGEKHKTFVDEPQHIAQGKVTEDFLKKLGIIYKIVDANTDYKKQINILKNFANKNQRVVALLIKKNTFKNNVKKSNQISKVYEREKYLNLLIDILPKNSIIVSTTGILSRELNEIINTSKKKINFFMCVGGMGHAISVASGLALKLKKKVFCFDGDGAATMHLGSLSSSSKIKNIIHILFNNHSHESVGGQDNAAKHVKFFRIAKEFGYKNSYLCKNGKELNKIINKSIKSKYNSFIEIILNKGHRKNISRPSRNMILLKNNFMNSIKK